MADYPIATAAGVAVKRRIDQVIKKKKAAQTEAMLQVPIDGCFLVMPIHDADGEISGTGTCLYVRCDKSHVRCLVTTSGRVGVADEGRMRIRQPWLTHDSQIVLMPEEEQARRVMLVAHGLGLRAIEEWVPEATS